MAHTESEIKVDTRAPLKSVVPQFEESIQNVQPLNSRRGRLCQLKCNGRKFLSKAALLVLIWNIVTNTIFGSMDNLIALFGSSDDNQYQLVTSVVPFVTLLFCALLSGWLADTYLGRYRVVKIGLVLLFVSAVLQAALVVALKLSDEDWSLVSRSFLAIIAASVSYGSAVILLVNLPQLGLDQMPDCSTTNITSFISWYIASFFVGLWIGDFSSTVGYFCGRDDFALVASLLPVALMMLVLVSDIFLVPKWLVIERKSLRSFKTIYKVLKFAKQHKAPLNRSALTYWEEDIPPRIDLGKSRYGGPFTTEQVEDVKTLLQILVLTIPLFISTVSFFLYSNTITLMNADPSVPLNSTSDENCSSQVLQYFTYNWYWLAIILTLVFEVAVYPLFGHKFPSSIRRMGASILAVVIGNTLCFFLSIYYLTQHSVPTVIAYIHSFGVAVMLLSLLTSSVEFVCAQSPYNMKGILLGYVWCINACAIAAAEGVFYVVDDAAPSKYIAMVIYTIAAALLSVVGFVLFCVLARWYKGRVRDDIATPHKWAEDYYDRYLPQNTKRLPQNT